MSTNFVRDDWRNRLSPSGPALNEGNEVIPTHDFVRPDNTPQSAGKPRLLAESGLHPALHPLPARNERGEDRAEGKPIKTSLLSPARSSAADGREGAAIRPRTVASPAASRATHPFLPRSYSQWSRPECPAPMRIGGARCAPPPSQTGRADLPHPAFQSVGALPRRSTLFARSPRTPVRPSVPPKPIALGWFHHRLALAGTRVGLSSVILSCILPPSCVPFAPRSLPASQLLRTL